MNTDIKKLKSLAQSILDNVDCYCNLDGVDDWDGLMLAIMEEINTVLDLGVDLPKTLDEDEN